MAYEIVMPQLSDSMKEGKLIRWKVKEGDVVEVGDTLAEVESDKAILEVQSFKKGRVTSLKLKEGEEAPIGTCIAEIETEAESVPVQQERKVTQKAIPATHSIKEKRESLSLLKESHPMVPQSHGWASPKAKALAVRYGIDIEALQKEHKLSTQVHEAEIINYRKRHYFTAKALALIERYHLSFDLFKAEKKQSEADIQAYIEAHNIPLPIPLSANQKAVIATVTEAVKKPTYHLYDTLDSTLITSYAEGSHTVTVWLLKLFAQAMMQHEALRTTLGTNGLQVWSSVAISVAMEYKGALYMPVIQAVERQTPDEIAKRLKTLKAKVKNQTLRPEEMQGSTFGLSNLGMTGIARFDAMVNGKDCGIAAIGTEMDGKIAVTLTLDHRIVNGYQGARFMQTLKSIAKDKMFFKGKR